MKHLLFLILITLSFLSNCYGQATKVDSILHNRLNQEEPALPTKDVIHHINEDVYIYDVISGYKIINDTLKVLYVGGKYPMQKVTVFVKGKEPNGHVDFKKGEKWHFSGKVFLYKRKPAITLTNSDQLATRILL